MKLEVQDELIKKFQMALDISGEDTGAVIERMLKTYIYDTVSRQQECFFGLEMFMKQSL